jgi:pyruvate kinase
MDRKAKIIATIGPSSKNIIDQLVKAGMDVARLNFSHGTYEDFTEIIGKIRQISTDLNKPVTILQDLQGPKLRVGNLPPEGIRLSVGQQVILTADSGNRLSSEFSPGDVVIPFEVPNLIESVKVGKKILLDDGHLAFEVSGIGKSFIKATVKTGGVLFSHKGVNLPGISLGIPGFTEKDKSDLEFGLKEKVDAIALSFIHNAQDVLIVRETISKLSPQQSNIPIIAKLELPEAIDNLEEILDAADGVMVARGDLAVETSPSKVPIMQKQIIEAANLKEKIVITATQMLDSMIQNPLPTRAEASDVANAVFDGTDVLMLSGETASGQYPVESILMMNSIICEAETHSAQWGHCQDLPKGTTTDDAISITWAARELAHDRNVTGIAVFTETGRTAQLMSKSRPQVPILAFTPILATYQRLSLLWGVIPFLVPYASTVESMLYIVDEAITSTESFHFGDQVIVISGFPVGCKRAPNFALLHTIGEIS